MNLLHKWLMILAVAGASALAAAGERRDISCSSSRLDCPKGGNQAASGGESGILEENSRVWGGGGVLTLVNQQKETSR